MNKVIDLNKQMENEEMQELVIRTESKILATNIHDFKKQADEFIKSLPAELSTDEDFAKAKETNKTLKTLEDRTRAAIDAATKGNKDVAELISTAEEIAESFRKVRLERDKLVKNEEAKRKAEIVDAAFKNVKSSYELVAGVIDALSITTPLSQLQEELRSGLKNKKSIDGARKGVNQKLEEILASLSIEQNRLVNRFNLLPPELIHLFPDAQALIASQDDLEVLIKTRAESEKQRHLAEKHCDADSSTIDINFDAPLAVCGEQTSYKICFEYMGSLEEARAIATELRERFGNSVKLTG